MDDRLFILEQSVRRLRLYAITSTLAIAALLIGAARPSDDVIRTRGIIVIDAQGRERILIGAPIPDAANRVRTDMERVERIWGPRFPRAYIDEYYPTYRHSMNGVLVLDENGHDRIALGDSVPDPNIGRRIGVGSGLIINDAQGFERSGYSLIDVDGVNRVVLGLDGDEGEAVVLSVHDDGPAGLNVYGPDPIFLGRAPAGELGAGSPPFAGLRIQNGDVVAHQLEAARP